MRTSLFLLSSLLLSPGCGGGELELRFSDPVVEARARRVVVQAFQGSCDAAFAVPASGVAAAVKVDGVSAASYPAAPSELMPDGADALVHVAAEDEDGRVVARACGPVDGELVLSALPPCAGVQAVDLAVVFDASEDMAFASQNLGGAAQVFRGAVLEPSLFAEGSHYSLFLHGGAGVQADLRQSASPAALGDALEAAESDFAGYPTPFAAMLEASRVLRDRASCARRPVMLVVSAGPSADEEVPPAEAAFGLYAAQGDRSDDIFSFGVGLGSAVVEELRLAIPQSVGEVRGAATGPVYADVLREASERLSGQAP